MALSLATLARAQNPAATSTARPPLSQAPADEMVALSPFEVQADSDNSYGAINSNSITRFNTELDHLPVSADIFNERFMKDIGATSVEDMVVAYSAGAGSALASPSLSSTSNQISDRNANSFVALRGLTAPTMQRDGFMPVNTYIQSGSTGTGFTSNFDVERVEVINGPQALLYGVGGAGGVINLVSKQARFGKANSGSLLFQVDQYGHKLGTFDYGLSIANRVAVRVAATSQDALASRRFNLGGPMHGLYLQVAVKLPFHTTVKLSGESTAFDRVAGTGSQTFTALSTANDARNGQRLRYLLATNQLQASATGPSGGGYIGNGRITWDNVDSYAAWWNTSEYTKTEIATLTADTQWNSWLSTQAAVGYRSTYDDRVGNTITFAAPNVATNPTGDFAVGMTGGIPLSDLSQPIRMKAVRFSALANNTFSLFGTRVSSQSILGADFVRTDGAVITYAYVKADDSFNPTKVSTANATGYSYGSNLYWNVGNGPVAYPLFHPRIANRVVYQGQNYVRVQTQIVQPNLIGPSNPLGLLAGGATPLGDYRLGKTLTKGIYAANYTNWLDGKLDVLLGTRIGDSFSVQATEAAPPSNNSTSSQLDTKSVSFNAGLDYAVLGWLRPYVSVSSSYDPPPIFVAGPLGAYPVASKGLGEEVGVKITNRSKTISGSIAVYHASSKNEEASLTSTQLFDINPSGLNGLYNAPSVWINVDRKAQGLQAALTATPVPGWNVRLSAAKTDGTVDSTRIFPQLYNDQFYANAVGQVTYKDGSLVYVSGTGSATPVVSTTAGAIPLTIAKMSTAGDYYYANPQLVTGAISRSSNVGKLLTVVDPVHGPILTGQTGLPISALQINPGFTPPGQIVTNVAGEKSTGYPAYSLILTNNYVFSRGWIKGLSIGGTATFGWQYRQFYYYPNGLSDPNTSVRSLYYWPTQFRFDGIFGYSRAFGRHYVFSTRLGINNMFNRYHVLILPNFTSGYAGPNDATFDQQPRSYVWSSTVSF